MTHDFAAALEGIIEIRGATKILPDRIVLDITKAEFETILTALQLAAGTVTQSPAPAVDVEALNKFFAAFGMSGCQDQGLIDLSIKAFSELQKLAAHGHLTTAPGCQEEYHLSAEEQSIMRKALRKSVTPPQDKGE